MYVFVPLQTGSGPTTGPVGTTVLPQLSVAEGGVGATASDKQFTVAEPGGGRMITGGLIV